VSWTARVRNPDLTLADPIEFETATLVENYNLPDMLSMEGELAGLRPAMQPGLGIYVTDEAGNYRFSGIFDPTGIERRGDRTGALVWASDSLNFWDRICYPVPANAWTTAGQNAAYDVQTGTVETRMLGYINRNMGSAARAERQVTRLRLPTSQGRGPSETTNMRFHVLGSWLGLAAAKADLRFRIVQTYDGTGAWLDVKIDTAADMSAWARFGTPEAGGPGMLGPDWNYRIGSPTGTTVLVAAGGTGAARVLSSGTDTAAQTLWRRRIEAFKDQRGTTDATEIATAVSEGLAEGVGSVEVSAPLGDSDLVLGGDIPVGSKISVVLDGVVIVDRLQQVTTVVSNDSSAPTVSVSGVVGSPDAGLQTPTQKKLAQALRRLTYLERSL
jgi:hypothetical protein